MLNSGDVFAGFTIERMLGEGGMGAVYLARHPRLGKQTALKLLKPELFADAAIRTRFEREADLAAQLEHPGIVAVYDRGAEDDHLWMCMQYIDGADAGTVNPFTLSPDKAVQIIDGVADALDYAHGKGVLHRDVKPSNILLARARPGQGERVFLTDFGLARLRAETVRLTQTGMFTATLAFASPEQMTGGDMDGRSDQYSLACALYWLLTGMAPFDSPNPADIIHGNLQLAVPPLAVKRRGLPPQLDAVLAKAMAKNPAHRYRTCLEFAAAAEYVLKVSGPPVAPGTRSTGGAPGYPADTRSPGGAPVPADGVVPAGQGPAAPGGQGAEVAGGHGAGALGRQSVGAVGGESVHAEVDPADRAEGRQPGAVDKPPAADPSATEPTVAIATSEIPDAGAGPAGAGHVGGVARGTAAGASAGPAYPADPRGSFGGTGTQQGGYPPGQGVYTPAVVPPQGYPPPRRSRAPWIAMAVLVPLIAVAVIVAGVLVVQGLRDSGSDSASAAADPSTATGVTLEAETDTAAPADPPDDAPADRTRRLFPTLLPQDDMGAGAGYRNTRCSRFTAEDRIPQQPRAPAFSDVLENQPWEAVWDCRRADLDPGSMDYSLITYPDADAVEEMVEALPPYESVSGAKDNEPYIAYFWGDPNAGGSSPFDVNMVVVFGTGVDSPRSNSVVFARHWGTSARQDLEQWWFEAPL